MRYDPCLSNQWNADAIQEAVTLVSKIRTQEGFEGRYVSPEYIKQCILDDMMAKALPAGQA